MQILKKLGVILLSTYFVVTVAGFAYIKAGGSIPFINAKQNCNFIHSGYTSIDTNAIYEKLSKTHDFSKGISIDALLRLELTEGNYEIPENYREVAVYNISNEVIQEHVTDPQQTKEYYDLSDYCQTSYFELNDAIKNMLGITSTDFGYYILNYEGETMLIQIRPELHDFNIKSLEEKYPKTNTQDNTNNAISNALALNKGSLQATLTEAPQETLQETPLQ